MHVISDRWSHALEQQAEEHLWGLAGSVTFLIMIRLCNWSRLRPRCHDFNLAFMPHMCLTAGEIWAVIPWIALRIHAGSQPETTGTTGLQGALLYLENHQQTHVRRPGNSSLRPYPSTALTSGIKSINNSNDATYDLVVEILWWICM